MLKIIEGQRYSFEIFSEDEADEQEVAFYIRAICKSTKRTSCINNLNAIMARLFEEKDKYLDDMRCQDSFWMVSKSEAKKFAKIALKYLSSLSYINYIEDKLDEDRREGEWENVYEGQNF